MNAGRVFTLARKEVQEILRDRLYLVLAFLLPVALLLVFGHGMTQDVEGIGVAIIDEDRSAASREYVARFVAAGQFRRVAAPAPAGIDRALTDGRARAVLWIGPGFERRLVGGGEADVLVLIDGAFTSPARTIGGHLQGINAQVNAQLRALAAAKRGSPGAAAPAQPIRVQTRFLYNPELRSIVVIAPSLIMLVLMLVPPLLIAVSIVREKESGAIYNIASSTVTRLEFLLGKLLPVTAISMLDAVVLWLAVSYYFGVAFRGNLAQLGFATLLYVLATAGIGLLVSAAVRTQQAAIIITTMAAVIVAIQFAGLFVPLDNAEPGNRIIAALFPAGYYLPVVRGMYLKGAGVAVFWPELLALAAYAAGVLWIAHALTHKRTRA